ncbi:MAG: YSIRK-type signal peptide-containing protein, partial [Staphylococcus epidermidis]|nr:YSIRK-type signal peptide-containing protein [Staphylococcus epidermidis]
MKKSSKFSKDFPTRKNHYAIRKFTVGTASIIVGSFLFFGQTQAHAEQAEEFERVTTGTVDTGGQPARADQGQEGPQAGADTHNTASQPGVTGQDAPNENHAGDQNAAVTHPANQENNAPQVGAGTPGAENTPQAGGENHN